MLANPGHRGFTLIELLIGFALVGLLTMMAVPAFQHWTQNMQIRNAAESILNGMQIARAEAVRRNAAVQMILVDGSTWTIAAVSTPGTIIQQRDSAEGSGTAAIAVTPGIADRITFNGMGWVVANDDGSASITSINVASAISANTAIRPLRILVVPGGSLKMCDPAVALAVDDPRKCPP